MFQLPDDDDDDFWKEMPLDDRTLSRVTTGKENVVRQHNLPSLRSASCNDVLGGDDRNGATTFPVNLQSTSNHNSQFHGVFTSDNKPSGYAVQSTSNSTVTMLNLSTSTGTHGPIRPLCGSEAPQTPPLVLGHNTAQVLNPEASPYGDAHCMAVTRNCAYNTGTPTSRGDKNLGNSRIPSHSATTHTVGGDQGRADVRSSTHMVTPTLGDRDMGHVRIPAPCKVTPTSGITEKRSTYNIATPTVGGDSIAPGEYTTPRRKRKFPGPAGILPQLGPGQSLDKLNTVVTPTSTFQKQKSPQDEAVLLSSQSTESMFSDVTWLRLLSDLGDDGHKLINKFSIAVTLLNAGKKQLVQGKAPLLFGMIEAIESHGSEARVTIRDRSGRMEGTLHRDLLKEYERELQVGTVLVLKQVSILSLSARKHYVNITPSNMLMVYHQCYQDGLRTLPFHGSHDSLSSVLKALEKKAGSHGSCTSASEPSTPGSYTGSSRLSGLGSSTGTPQLCSDANRLVSPQFSSDGPRLELRTPVRGVRDVSVVTNINTPSGTPGQSKPKYSRVNNQDLPSRYSNNYQQMSNNTFKQRESNSEVVVSERNSVSVQSNNRIESNTPKRTCFNTMVSRLASSSEKSTMQSMIHQTNIVNDRVGGDVSSPDGQSHGSSNTPSSRGPWRFKPRTPVGSNASPYTPTPNSVGRSCQIGGITDTVTRDTGGVTTPSQGRSNPAGAWRGGLNNVGGNFRCDTGVASATADKLAAVNRPGSIQSVNQRDDQDLWGDGMDDDLTDEILSQL